MKQFTRYLWMVMFLNFLLTGALHAATKPIGYVVEYGGDVKITRHGGQVKSADLNLGVFPQDLIETSRASSVRVLFENESVLDLGPSTRLLVDKFVYQPRENLAISVFKLLEGRVRAAVSHYFNENYEKRASRFEVHSPTAVAGVRGTQFVMTAQSGVSEVFTLDGEVSVWSFGEAGDNPLIIRGGEFTRVHKGAPPTEARRIPPAILKQLKQRGADGPTVGNPAKHDHPLLARTLKRQSRRRADKLFRGRGHFNRFRHRGAPPIKQDVAGTTEMGGFVHFQ